MARAKITYRYNPKTGKREMHIDYQSDSDADRIEHEQEHRALVKELVGDIGGGDGVSVDRGGGDGAPEPSAERTPPKAVRKPKAE